MPAFQRLLEIKKDTVVHLARDRARVAACPDMGGRVFVELDGQCAHRIDLAAVARPGQPFNNFGGVNLWPAPEGGPFGFNYEGSRWYVQPAINVEPFAVRERTERSVLFEKKAALINRKGIRVEVVVTRRVAFSPLAACIEGCPLAASVAVETRDEFTVTNRVASDQALIAAWNLEQFTATGETVAFIRVADPRESINWDFYEPHPKALVSWCPHGFTFRTDGRHKGQIGIRKAARPEGIGFYDLARRWVCLKENLTPLDGMFFNIADNDQPAGPWSAADTYSIFNSDADMAAFELETIGPLHLEGGRLARAPLVSRTTYAIFETADAIRIFLDRYLGKG
ncbi:MAG: DUF6786 family protein [Verrucomicrobiia bacterium]